LWATARDEGWATAPQPAIDATERRNLFTRIDVLVGRAFGLGSENIAWITRDDPANARGLWRLDRDLPTAQRRPARWSAASTP
jgi:hypothetical protein